MTGSPTSATIAGTARAASSLLTVTRTSSEPAACRARTCATVAATSAVSVLVIDWTTMEWQEPTRTEPTETVTVWRRDMGCNLVEVGGGWWRSVGARSTSTILHHPHIPIITNQCVKNFNSVSAVACGTYTRWSAALIAASCGKSLNWPMTYSCRMLFVAPSSSSTKLLDAAAEYTRFRFSLRLTKFRLFTEMEE